jgi:23S rRNA pseudouridine1911/1915/1917 synthase
MDPELNLNTNREARTEKHELSLSTKMPEMSRGIQIADARRRPEPEEGPLTIIHEDEWTIVLDKPPGVVVHPTYKNASGTLLNAVLWRVRERAGAQPGILTRLDKDTSGLVVVALTPDTHAIMQKDVAAGRIHKEYLAVVRGIPQPSQGTIVLPLGRDLADRRLVVVRPDGARCETRYEVLSTCEDEDMSLVRCQLITGRTHQIRVHLAASGWPVVGDHVYGGPDASIARQALHAWRVSLPHPVTRQRLELEAPLPDDMRRLSVLVSGL